MYILIVLLFGMMAAYAQPPQTDWARSWAWRNDTETFDSCFALCKTTDGGYVLAGESRFWPYTISDILTIRVAPNGDSLWTRNYDFSPRDRCYAVCPAPQESFLMAGRVADAAWIGRMDGNGDLIWNRGLGLNAHLRTIESTESGDFLATGWIADSAGNFADPLVVLVDGNGDTLWTRRIELAGQQWCYDAAVLPGGDFLMGCGEQTATDTFAHPLLMKLNADGDVLWQRSYDFAGQFTDVEPLSTGEILAVPYREETWNWIWRTARFPDLMKLSAAGDTIWTRMSPLFHITRCIETLAGDYIIAGSSVAGWNYSMKLQKYDSSGNSRWIVYGSMGMDCVVPLALLQSQDGGYVYAGNFAYGEVCNEPTNSLLVKTHPEQILGNLQFMPNHVVFDSVVVGALASLPVVIRNGGNEDIVIHSAPLAWNFHLVLTDSFLLHANEDTVLSVQFTPDDASWFIEPVYVFTNIPGPFSFIVSGTGVNPVTAERKEDVVPSDFALHEAHPNPFNSTATISFEIPHQCRVLLNVFDITGRSVATLADEVLAAGVHQVNFDASALPSGIYIYRLQAGGFSQSRKLVHLK